MLKNGTTKLFKKFVKSHNLRNGQRCRVSYIHNPGSEPLSLSTVGDVIAETCHRYPGRIAIRSIHEDLSITYEELLNQSDSLGFALRQNGLGKGDRLGIWSHNNAEWIIALVAAARAGLISVLMNPVYEKPEISYCIKKAHLKALVIGDNINNRSYNAMLRQLIPALDKSKEGKLTCKEFPTLTSVISCGKEKFDGIYSMSSLIKSYEKRDVSMYGQEVKSEDGSNIHFTSGTTSNPKAALTSHLGVVNNSYYIGKRHFLHEGHQIVCVQVPLFHALGSIVTLMSALRHGSTIVLAGPSYNVDANIKALIQEKCTVVTGTPTMYVDILSKIREETNLPFNLRVAMSAAAPCSPELIRKINKYFKADSVKALYGMTELTASVFQSNFNDGVDLVAQTVGYIQDHVELKVVDENKNMVPFGSRGELMARGYMNMIRYWGEPEKTKETIDEEGWLATGDLFTISKDGYGRIVGRLKDIIVRGGENIAPKEVEDLLNTHPDILESQVIGVADERLGEELCAVLRLREGASFTLDDVRKYCEGRLAKFKIPRIVKSTDIFPKTASGKIQKYRLKEIIESGKL